MPTMLALVPIGSRSQPSSRSGRVPSSVDVAEDVEGNIDSSNLWTSPIQLLFVGASATVSASDVVDSASADASKGGSVFVSTAGEAARISRNRASIVASSTALTELGESCEL